MTQEDKSPKKSLRYKRRLSKEAGRVFQDDKSPVKSGFKWIWKNLKFGVAASVRTQELISPKKLLL